MKNKHKILLVADDATLLDALSRELLKKDLLFCQPGDQVMQSVFDEVPHLIIIDENYKDSQGRNVALNIKEDAVLKYIPIILLVNQEEHAHRKYGLIDFYARKSHSVEKIMATVREALTRNYNELDLNPLTHLPGTRSSLLRIERAINLKKPFAVCCVDLSDMAAFNSAYGVARGDEIITHLAEIIKDSLDREGSPDDFLGHLGGDDLLVVTRSDYAVPIAESVIQTFDSGISNFYDPHDRAQGYIVQRNKEGILTHYPLMGVCMAIVHSDHMPMREMPQISQIAGQLKKYIKGLAGSCYVKYQKGYKATEKGSGIVEVRFPTKMKSVRLMASGKGPEKSHDFFNAVINAKAIQPVYQPIVDIKTRQIHGYESLTRGSADSPFDDAAMLFSVARESGRVKELDKLCLDCALKSAQALPPDKKLFLNLNHETLIDPKVMKDLFAEKGVIGFKNIVIEVTEQSILRSFDKVRDALLELKEQGVSVAIDDVGGGAVSLRDVAILKPDYIKFDKTLIRQIDTSITKQQIVLSMKLFANGIQAMTTAEGIETREEYETLLMCGIALGQGYYFARPGKAFPAVML